MFAHVVSQPVETNIPPPGRWWRVSHEIRGSGGRPGGGHRHVDDARPLSQAAARRRSLIDARRDGGSAMTEPIEAVLVGAGNRGHFVYGAYALRHPDQLRFVAVAE